MLLLTVERKYFVFINANTFTFNDVFGIEMTGILPTFSVENPRELS